MYTYVCIYACMYMVIYYMYHIYIIYILYGEAVVTYMIQLNNCMTRSYAYEISKSSCKDFDCKHSINQR